MEFISHCQQIQKRLVKNRKFKYFDSRSCINEQNNINNFYRKKFKQETWSNKYDIIDRQI